jgi:dolichyl-diphosphooligosaccharide--protein glycosyltransferase
MKLKRVNVYALIIFIFVVYVADAFYFTPATQVARGSGTVLSDNWFESLNWIKNNTDECAVIATYWDPGHFITGIARRAVVFDGASQNALFTRQRGNETVTTARISDIATTLYTTNESQALEILSEYKKPGCDEMYYIASADLIGKSQWWTYFATWNPVDKGHPLNYITAQLSGARPILQQNAIAYTYPLGQQQSFVVYEQNETLTPFLQQNNQFLRIATITYYTRSGQFLVGSTPNADVQGTLWVDPSRSIVIFMPPELERAMFTRLFFFNGAGLDNFELVGNWGGEVKLFKIIFPPNES